MARGYLEICKRKAKKRMHIRSQGFSYRVMTRHERMRVTRALIHYTRGNGVSTVSLLVRYISSVVAPDLFAEISAEAKSSLSEIDQLQRMF